MAIAVAILGTLLSLLFIGGCIALAAWGFQQQQRIQQDVASGFQETAQHILNASVALNNEASQRHDELVELLSERERVSIWIAPSDGCEICGAEAVVVCAVANRSPIWLCGQCHQENEAFE